MTSRQLCRLLLQNGFVEKKGQGRGSHRTFYHHAHGYVVVPFHSTDIKKGLLHGILKKAGLLKLN